MANALDYDDTGPGGHPGATVIPPAIATAETVHASGKRLITAVVLGYELVARVRLAMQRRSPYFTNVAEAPLHCGLTTGIFGAVTSAGKLLDLDDKLMAMAMGIAGSAAPVPSDMKCSLNPMNKRLGMGMVKNNYGYMCEIGARAALAAKIGYTGPFDILDGDTGFWNMAGYEGCNFQKMTDLLGQKYNILEVGFKSYPCCWHTHSAIDAALKIVNKHNIALDDIDKIVVKKITSHVIPPWDDCQPKTMGSAVYSLPYPIAAALTGLRPGPKWFTKDKLNDVEILSLARKVQLVANPEAEKVDPLYTFVEITSREKRYCETVTLPRGDPENPLKEEDIREKFMRMALPVIEKQRAVNLMDKVLNLDKVEDVTSLTTYLRL